MKRCLVLVREVAHLDVALSYVTDYRTAVDGGAHVGLWTERMAQRFQRVVAVEPWLPHAEELVSRVPAAEVVHAALGEQAGVAGIQPGQDNDGQYHLVEGSTVRVIPLDALGLTDVDFMKLDLEGSELPALRGAEQTIKRCRPVIVVEESGLGVRYGVEPGEVGRWLEAHGYHRVEQLNKDGVWVP